MFLRTTQLPLISERGGWLCRYVYTVSACEWQAHVAEAGSPAQISAALQHLVGGRLCPKIKECHYMSFSDYLLNKMIPETNASTSFLWSPQGEEGQSKWIKMQVCTVFFLKREHIFKYLASCHPEDHTSSIRLPQQGQPRGVHSWAAQQSTISIFIVLRIF